MSRKEMVKAYLQTFLICALLGFGLMTIGLLLGINFWVMMIVDMTIGGVVGYFNMKRIVEHHRLMTEIIELQRKMFY